MIAEPYICTKGPRVGEITWQNTDPLARLYDPAFWQPYADFEREKLENLMADKMGITVTQNEVGYLLHLWPEGGSKTVTYDSHRLMGYSTLCYYRDSDSSRLLRRSEFLRTVCEREGVEWLPKGKCNACNCCLCPCHR